LNVEVIGASVKNKGCVSDVGVTELEVKKEDRRKSVRVASTNGLVILRSGGSQPITCKLLNLSEGGCRLGIDARDAGIWNKVNKPNQALELLLSSTPHLDRFVVTAEVKNVRPLDAGALELGVQFRPMEPKRCGVLRLALLKLATERLRSSNSGIIAKPQPNPDEANPAATPGLTDARPSEISAVPSKGTSTIPRATYQTYWQDPFQGKRLGEVLVRMGKLKHEEIEHALEECRGSREPLGQYLVKHGKVTPAELCRGLALASGMPTTDLNNVAIRRTFKEIFSVEIMKRYEFIPFDASSKVVCIATGSPFPEPVLKEIKSLTSKRVEVFLAEEELVLHLLNKTEEEMAAEAGQAKNRRYPRYNMPLPIEYYFCSSGGERLDETTYVGQTINISEGGFRIEGPQTDFGRLGNVQAYGLYVQVTVKFSPHEFAALCKPVFVYEKEIVEVVQFPLELGLSIMDISEGSREHLEAILEIAKKLTSPTVI
jgi:c-di-GMP-binding flagellar brake protein YcgR